ncbi:hypothetical protein L873DRAFT_1400522 [Choiromyces venosus 120613-1]|uniref:Uncharacterized protein n=1 Tax=Choiromyces venosus 120613-1 TaxID=1336337 RepID=A0A3N4JCF2_9PEZI|nr:hypothetical protein L873DRAFT_1400522 [Choiromyces venosus 120613-1]
MSDPNAPFDPAISNPYARPGEVVPDSVTEDTKLGDSDEQLGPCLPPSTFAFVGNGVNGDAARDEEVMNKDNITDTKTRGGGKGLGVDYREQGDSEGLPARGIWGVVV